MFKQLKPTPSMAVAVIALLISLSGAAYAGVTIPKDSVGSRELKPRAVGTENIQGRAVTPKKIDAQAVTKSRIAKKAVDTAQLANDSVNANKIQPGTIQPEHLTPAATITGPQGPQGPAGTATAFAMVAANGTLVCDGAQSIQCSNIAATNVTRVQTGVYCFHDLSFTPKSITASAADVESFVRARLVLPGNHTEAPDCTNVIPNTKAVVAMDNESTNPHNETFYVWFQ